MESPSLRRAALRRGDPIPPRRRRGRNARARNSGWPRSRGAVPRRLLRPCQERPSPTPRKSSKDRRPYREGSAAAHPRCDPQSLRHGQQNSWPVRYTRGQRRDFGRSRALARVRKCLARRDWCTSGRRPSTDASSAFSGAIDSALTASASAAARSGGAVVAHVRCQRTAQFASAAPTIASTLPGSSARARSKSFRASERLSGVSPLLYALIPRK